MSYQTSSIDITNDPNKRRRLLDLDERRKTAMESTQHLKEIFGNDLSSSSKQYVTCPKCGKEVGATRFAPHLHKCQSSSTTNTTSGNNTNSMNSSINSGIVSFLFNTFGSSSSSNTINNNTSNHNHSTTGTSTSTSRSRSSSITGYNSSLNNNNNNNQTLSPQSYRIMWDAPCHNCRSKDAPELMMLCDGCSHVYHIHCVIPRLETIPPSPWLCSRCLSRVVEYRNKPTTISNNNNNVLSALDKVMNGAVAGHESTIYGCDSCNMEIPSTAYRWRCLVCFETDVCESCLEKSFDLHKSNHYMVKLRMML
jgi:hypothetical protein